MTNTVPINASELQFIELFRMALSESTNEERMRAIRNVKHEVAADVDELILEGRDQEWLTSPSNAAFMRHVALRTSSRRVAANELSQTERRYEGSGKSSNELWLNRAEYIGMCVRLSIRDGKFEGLQTETGILEQVRNVALRENISGAKDLDTLRKAWGMYRGVVHLGMALDICEDNPDSGYDVLKIAEEIRQEFSTRCPRGTVKPYVAQNEQFSFIFKNS